MNLVISALERRALIRRRPDPHHGRVLRASVTAKGLKVLERCDRNMDAIEADMLDGLDPDTVDAVRDALRSCAHSLEATRPLPRPRPLASAEPAGSDVPVCPRSVWRGSRRHVNGGLGRRAR